MFPESIGTIYVREQVILIGANLVDVMRGREGIHSQAINRVIIP